MAYKLILQEICPECEGIGRTKKICEDHIFSDAVFINCHGCSGKGYIYQEEHLVPELKERIILNFEKES